MKTVRYTATAIKTLRTHWSEAARIRAKIARYAETGAGDVKALVGSSYLRLRIGDYRAILSEGEAEILVIRIGHRGDVYD
ncbi:type II toxin-antitoxin system RelE family toxin [Amorphus coralli]|uniref:type II toxin-antitoxin system RelE family toxin n=1 Tax=Amorphus coralli TaxID=340680 RepID=UPI000381631E|nr:type II toxin-antitoxin system RelE/ParE family toxin [Amorphus coralli]